MRQPDISWSINAVGEAGFLGKVITTPENNEKIDRISKEVWATHSSARMILASGTTEEFWYACRGSNILHFVVIANSSFESVKERLNTLWMILLGIAGMVLVSSCFIGLLLSDQFLRPIADLTSGVKSIEARDFRFQIPIHGNDELGELSLLMNDVMEGMKDLQVARIVQESLFPAQPVAANGYRIWGKSRSMTDIGGDYFDYFRLDEHRGLVIIGDVSGHGIGAALVVAMAKAIIGHPASSGKPIEILASLNGILFTILKRKKMMSCCLSIFDTQTGILTMANAGQSFPILLGKGSPRFLELKGYPLGSTKNWKAATAAFGMNENDVVLFYTDGLIEANDTSGQQIGYERFIQQLPSLIVDSAAATENAIRRWHKLLTREVPPDDDISLIVLQRGAVQRPPYFGKSL